jgi:hypothetical protein
MAADTSVPSADYYSAQAIANRALERANEIALRQVKLEADLNAHLTWCMKARDEDRAEDRAWRENLGKRLDRLDAKYLSAGIALVAILLSVVGWMFAHGKFGP